MPHLYKFSRDVNFVDGQNSVVYLSRIICYYNLCFMNVPWITNNPQKRHPKKFALVQYVHMQYAICIAYINFYINSDLLKKTICYKIYQVKNLKKFIKSI